MYKLKNGDIISESAIIYILAPSLKNKGKSRIVMCDNTEFDCEPAEAEIIMNLCNHEDDIFTSAMEEVYKLYKSRNEFCAEENTKNESG